MRRVVLLVALALVGVLAVPGSAALEPHTDACPVLSDPAKDDRNADLGTLEDPALDILGGSVGVKDGKLVVVLRMTKVGMPTWADGVQYSGGFRYDLQQVEIYGIVARSNPWTKSFMALQGIHVDGWHEVGSDKFLSMTLDPARGTVTLSMPMDRIAAALDLKKLRGTGLDVRLSTAAHYTAFIEPYDRATTFAQLRLAGCR